MDDMGHVWVLWLGRGTVCGHVEVAWHLGRDAHPRGLVGRPRGWGAGLRPGVRQIRIWTPAWPQPRDSGAATDPLGAPGSSPVARGADSSSPRGLRGLWTGSLHVKHPAQRLLQGQGSKRQLPTIALLALVPTVGWGTTFRPADQQSFLELQINTVGHQKERGLRLGRGPSESPYFVGTSVSNTQLWTSRGNIPVFARA